MSIHRPSSAPPRSPIVRSALSADVDAPSPTSPAHSFLAPPPLPEQGFIFSFVCKARPMPSSFLEDFRKLMAKHEWFDLGMNGCVYFGAVNNLHAFVPTYTAFKDNVTWHKTLRFVAHRNLLAEESELPNEEEKEHPDEEYLLMYYIKPPVSSLPSEFNKYLMETGGWQRALRGVFAFSRATNNLSEVLPLFILQHPALAIRLSACHLFRLQSSERLRMRKAVGRLGTRTMEPNRRAPSTLA